MQGVRRIIGLPQITPSSSPVSISPSPSIDSQTHQPWFVRTRARFSQFLAFTRYTRHYRRFFIDDHRPIDLSGFPTQEPLAMRLENVYVELRTKVTPPHQASANPLHLPEELETGRHLIWEYLQPRKFSGGFVVLGPPGSGKSTLLKHIALRVAEHRWPSWFRRRHLPIFLSLREHSQMVQDHHTSYTLADAVRAIVRTRSYPMPSGWIDHWLTSGRCIVLLDGLDEVVDLSSRQRMGVWVQEQIRNYGQNTFVVTSRPHGYRTAPLQRPMTILEIQALKLSQIERLLVYRYQAREEFSSFQEQQKAQEDAQALFLRIRETPALLALAVNPLLLTMIHIVHIYRGELPKNRVTLYQEICEVFLGTLQEARNIQYEVKKEQRYGILQSLAYQMMIRGIRDISSIEAEQSVANALRELKIEIPVQGVLKSVEYSSGLLLESDLGTWAFAHLTLQEYLAAMYIREHSLEQMLLSQIESFWWHETIRLYCAQVDATLILNTCLALPKPSIAVLTLVLECLQEAHTVKADVREHLNQLVIHWQTETNPERLHLVGEALLTQRFRQMHSLNDRSFLDTSLITNMEYQLFLDQQMSSCPQSKLQETQKKSSGWDQPVLGIHRGEALAFCEWLTNRDREGWCYRLPNQQEMHQRVVNVYGKGGYWINGTGKSFAWVNGKMPDALQEHLFSLRTSIYDLFRITNNEKTYNGLLYHMTSFLDQDLSQILNPFHRRLDRALAHDQDLTHEIKSQLSERRSDLLRNYDDSLKYFRSLTDSLIYQDNKEKRAQNYISLLVLQEITTGRLPLCENLGILLVREHQLERDQAK